LHIACAITAKADYFLTTDKGILKKSQMVSDIQIKDPIDFIREVWT
jgi:predicted nucleic acid-binding protein